MPCLTHYGAADYVVMPWKNGGGTATELARDEAGEDYGWRLSIADLVGDGSFSTFEGTQRVITVLEGAGMQLTVDGETGGDLRPLEAYAFDGSSRTECALLDGAIRDLIYRADRISARFEWVELPDTRKFLTAAPTVLVFNANTRLTIRLSQGPGRSLNAYELLRIDSPRGPVDISLSAVAEGHCALMELWPVGEIAPEA